MFLCSLIINDEYFVHANVMFPTQLLGGLFPSLSAYLSCFLAGVHPPVNFLDSALILSLFAYARLFVR